MRMPGALPEGEVSRLLIGMLDMAPTLLGLLGHEAPASWQGHDLSSAIREQDDDAVVSLPIFNFRPSWRGVYTRRYTFALEQIERTPDLQTRLGSDLGRPYTRSHNVLYDREADPLQLSTLINATEHIDLAMKLTDATFDWCQAFRDPFLSYKQLIEAVGEHEEGVPIELITASGA
jgi:arylsulfatase A-like enzyme